MAPSWDRLGLGDGDGVGKSHLAAVCTLYRGSFWTEGRQQLPIPQTSELSPESDSRFHMTDNARVPQPPSPPSGGLGPQQVLVTPILSSRTDLALIQ